MRQRTSPFALATPSRFLAAVLLAAALLAAACGGAADSPSQPSQPATPVVAIVAVAGTATVESGKTTILTAQARDASGAVIAGKTFTWSTSDATIAAVGSDGTVTGKAVGTASISATTDGKTGSLAISVTAPAPVVASVVVTGTAALQAGATTRLTATVKDATGATITSVPVVWSTSDSTNMPVASDGTVTAAHITTATITATAGGKTGSLDVASSLAPFTFNIPAGVADAQLIKDAVQFAAAFYKTTLGRTIAQPTAVGVVTGGPPCDRGGSAAATTAGSVTFCTNNQGWTANGPISRRKITIHELFHVLQFEQGWLTKGPSLTGPDWVIEGSAELMGYYGVDAWGLLPMATTRGCVVKEVTDFAKQQPPGLPPLSTVESASVFQQTVGPIYSYSLTAMDQLTTNAGGVGAILKYGDAIGAGTPWQTAFQTSFGTSVAAFYSQYPAYYATLPIPAQYLCRV